jgi:transcriptional regulator with XRE-family HTH domain
MIGYTLHIQQRNRKADKRKLGARLGKYCISYGIPVADLVGMFGVSRQTVYSWFCGVHEPGPSQRARITELFPHL